MAFRNLNFKQRLITSNLIHEDMQSISLRKFRHLQTPYIVTSKPFNFYVYPSQNQYLLLIFKLELVNGAG